ncbi:MAG: ABC transporter permease [Oscillospiraceae bacterium]|nr:ABC transporter permease [Oscillospiraceae bacterium]
MKTVSLALRNLLRKPGRTAALAALTALLAFSVFGGSIVVRSLRHGLDSLESRLGADIIVVPSSAQSKVSFQNMLLQGTTGAFYMDAANLDRVREVDGVALASPQLFLASLKADCCSVKIQVIGFDPETDFFIRPWMEESVSRELGELDVVVGCKVEAEVGEIIRIYDERCKVIGRLAATGTGLDTAVYCNMDTMKTLLQAAEAKGVSHKVSSGDSDEQVSAIYVKVREGCDIGEVNSKIQGHTRKASAVRTKSMLTDVSDSLAGISSTVTLLIAAVWVLALVILLIAFVMIANERKREFAVLRLIGMSRGMLSGMILKESALCSLAGGLIGILLAALAVFPFTTLIETSLGLPYLRPETGVIVTTGLLALAAAVGIGSLAASWAAFRLSRVDPGTVLREGN